MFDVNEYCCVSNNFDILILKLLGYGVKRRITYMEKILKYLIGHGF